MGMVAHNFNHRILKAEAGRFVPVPAQPGLHSEVWDSQG